MLHAPQQSFALYIRQSFSQPHVFEFTLNLIHVDLTYTIRSVL